MHSRTILLLSAVLFLSELTWAQSSPTSSPNPPSDPCSFEGNSDFYGIGVRVGFYLTWISGLVAFLFNPDDCEEQADAQTIFLAANLIAVLVLQVQDAAHTKNVVPILLFYMFFGGSVIGITSATASLGSWRKSSTKEKISQATRQVFVQLTFFGMLIYSFYFWTRGFEKFDKFPPECGGTYVFPVKHRISLETPSGGSVLALLLLVLFYIIIWFVAYKRLRASYPKKAHLSANGHETYEVSSEQLPPWDKGQR